MNTSSSSFRLARVEALMAEGRHAEAEAECESILAKSPADPGARYLAALAQIRQDRPGAARERLESLVADQPGSLAARYLLADVQRVTGLFAASAASYWEALSREFALKPVEGSGIRLQALLEFVASAPAARWKDRLKALAAWGHALERSGHDLGEADLAERLAHLEFPRLPWEEFRARFAAACALLALGPDTPRARTEQACEGVLLPWMRTALDADRYDNALEIEITVYQYYVRQTETQEHFRRCFELWRDTMRAAGRRCAERHPLPVAPGPGSRPRVAFFVHNVTPLAHVMALLEVLEGHHELREPLIEPYLFFLRGDPRVVERFRAAGVRTEPLGRGAPGEGMGTSMLALRQRLAEEGVGTIAWISLATGMPFAFAMRIAPRQVWWAMKYHALEFAEIDDYLTGGGDHGTATIQGRTWRVGPVVAGQWTAPELEAQARQVRAGLGDAGIVFGSFGRAEKLDSPVFLDAVAAILRACPEAIFLWTGQSRNANIQGRLESAGVAARCRFIGWVNTKLYAQVIDIFLDSFPFPCGFTLFEAMAAGKPAVLFDSDESSHGGINAIVGPLLDADPRDSEEARLARTIFMPDAQTRYYLRAADADEYVKHALALAGDAEFRRRAGQAHRDFIERLMTDRRRAARIYVGHLLGAPEPAPGAPR